MKMGEREGVMDGMKSPGQQGGPDPGQAGLGLSRRDPPPRPGPAPSQLGTGGKEEGLGGT